MELNENAAAADEPEHSNGHSRARVELRPKGVLADLCDERRAMLHQWLKSQLTYLQICRRIKEEWNLSVWPTTLSRYYARFIADEVIAERQKSVGVVALVNEDIDKSPADYAKAILDLLGDRTFDTIGNPSAHPKVVANWVHIFNNLRASEKNLELRERDLAAKERELTLKEKKFDEAQKTIADPKLSSAEIGARCRQIFAPLFGDDQAEPKDNGQEFLPAFFREWDFAIVTQRKRKTTGGSPATVSPLELLLPYQKRWVRDQARFKICVQARQTGKSFQTACEAISSAFTDPGTKWVCLSSGERQSLEWMEKAKEWADAFRLAIETYTEDRAMGQALLRVAEIRFANDSRIIAIPANPSTARGYSANIILDEFAYHDDPDAVWAAMFPALTNPLGDFKSRYRALFAGEKVDLVKEQRKIRVVSTFNGRQNKFFSLWENREKNGYSSYKVSIHDAIREGLQLNADELRDALDDPDIWAQEYECEPIDSSNVLLPYDLIAQAETIDATEVIDPDFFETNRRREIFCGIDFGRSNDPTVCWTLELVGDTLWTREVLVLDKMSTPEQNNILSQRIKASRRTALDYTGPGIGFGDYAVKDAGMSEWKPEEHHFGKVELFTFTPKSKRLLFPTLRRRFEAPCRIRVPVSRKVREDLHAMQQVVNKGEYSYWAPRTREGHSDRCTALALAVRAAGESTAGAIRDPKVIHFGRPAASRFGQFQPMRLAS